MGYNGFLRGIGEPAKFWKDKREKYPRVVHAELNAILNSPFDLAGSTLYCTHRPCHRCMIYAAQSKVARVVYDQWYSGPLLNEKVWGEAYTQFQQVVKM